MPVDRLACQMVELTDLFSKMVKHADTAREVPRKMKRQEQQALQEKAAQIARQSPHLGGLYFEALDGERVKELQTGIDDEISRFWRKDVLAHPDKPKANLDDLWPWFQQWCEVPKVDLALLPPDSAFLQFRFTLAKPYLSQNDEAFYILDNPMRKDKVFRLPFVSPTGWKGALRSAMRLLRKHNSWEAESKDMVMVRLFGHVKCERDEDVFRRGRLAFFPTFFDQIGLEVINPHDRGTGAGTRPIYFECVPPSCEGVFTLLYVPFDLIGLPDDWRNEKGQSAVQEIAEDLEAIANGVTAMLLIYGFGAKTSSGYGTAKVALKEIKWEVNRLVERLVETAESTLIPLQAGQITHLDPKGSQGSLLAAARALGAVLTEAEKTEVGHAG